ncbi:MAG: DUF5677 domain-containing protein [Paracoccaceae bacterium]
MGLKTRRSKGIEETVQSLVADLPRKLLAKRIAENAEKQGYEVGPWTETLATRLFDSDWDISKIDHSDLPDIEVSLGKDDLKRILEEAEEFIANEVPKIVSDLIEKASETLERSLFRRWPQEAAYQRSERFAFQQNLEVRWGKMFDAYRILLTSCREIGHAEQARLARSRAKKDRLKRAALLGCHARSMRVAHEVLVLAESGFADGALARWRTLYETTITMMVLERCGEEISERYFASYEVVKLDELKNELRLSSTQSNELQEALKQQTEIVDELKSVYGEAIAARKGYGWSAPIFSNNNDPTFRDLERFLGAEDLPQTYKVSSYRIHANSAGLLDNLADLVGEGLFLAGSTNAGLDAGCELAAHSAALCTSLLPIGHDSIEAAIQIKVIEALRWRVSKEAKKAAKKLFRDHERAFFTGK